MGTNRYTIKPGPGISKTLGHIQLELTCGISFYTVNYDFYQGKTRSQAPIGSLQGHLNYNFKKGIRAARYGTYYWGSQGRSIELGATFPGAGYSSNDALLGEIITTFMLVILLVVFIGFRSLGQYTPYMIPFLYAIMVPLETVISGTCTNPARSLGPAVISGHRDRFWIYLAGPVTGALLASLAGSALAKKITIAKLYHFDSESEGDALLRRK